MSSKQDDKRFYRQLKKQIKDTGKKKARLFYKKQLEENPTEAPFDAYDYGHDESAALNGRDGTNRKRKTKNGPDHKPGTDVGTAGEGDPEFRSVPESGVGEPSESGGVSGPGDRNHSDQPDRH